MRLLVLLALILAACSSGPPRTTAEVRGVDTPTVYADSDAFASAFPDHVLEDFSGLDSASLFTRFISPLHADQVERLFRSDSLPKVLDLEPGFAVGAADIGIVVAEHAGMKTIGNNAYGRPLVITFGAGARAAGFTCYPHRSTAVTAFTFAGEPIASDTIRTSIPAATAAPLSAEELSRFVGFASPDVPIGYIRVEHLDGGDQSDIDDVRFVPASGSASGVRLRGHASRAQADSTTGRGRVPISVTLENASVPLLNSLTVRVLGEPGGAGSRLPASLATWDLNAAPLKPGERTGFTALSPPLPRGSYSVVVLALTPEEQILASVPLHLSVL